MSVLAQIVSFETKAIFWDDEFNEPVVIVSDSLMYRGFEKTPVRFKPLNIDKSKLNEMIPLNVKGTTYLIEESGGVVVKYSNRQLERIDNSFTHKNQYGSIPFVYNDEIYLLGGYGLFTAKNILIKYDFKLKEWFLVETKGDIPDFITYTYYHVKKEKIYFIQIESNTRKENNNNPVVYQLDLETKSFSKIGYTFSKSFSNIQEIFIYRQIFQLNENKIIIREASNDRNNSYFLIDFENNYYNTLDLDYEFNPASKIIKIDEENEKYWIFTKSNSTQDFMFVEIDFELFTSNLKNKQQLYEPIPKSSYQLYLYSLLIILIAGLFILVIVFAKKYNKLIINLKKGTLSYRFTALNDFSKEEIDLLLKIAINKNEFINYSELLNHISTQTNTYETLKKKRKLLLSQITDKLQRYMNGKAKELFIFDTDPHDKRSKLIKLNEKLVIIR